MGNYSSEWIHQLESKRHWIFYWNQFRTINAVLEEGDRILEIGVGTRFTSNYLKSKGYDVTTLDIDAQKNPDIVADIVTRDLPGEYDHILGFEVFEHIPFEDFKQVLLKLHRVCKKYLFLSLPRNEKVWLNAEFEVPGSRKFRFRMATKRNKILSRHHHWEVDYGPYNNNMLQALFTEKGFQTERIEKVDSLFFYSLKRM
jgi:ubiquinone/menaquinone biosynthesis C-methylase UbiE